MARSVAVLTESAAVDLYGTPNVSLHLATAKPKTSSGASTYVYSATSYGYGYRQLPAVADYDEHEIALSAGTWTLVLLGWQGASLGRVAVSLDGVQLGIIDQYDPGSTVADRVVYPGIAVRTGGTHLLRFTVLSKNALSGGAAVRLSTALLTRQPATAVPDADLDWTYHAVYFEPSSIGTDGVVYGWGGSNGRAVCRTTDGGVTIEEGANLGAQCNAGEYLRFVTRTTEGFVVGTSTGVDDPAGYARLWFSTSFDGPFVVVQDGLRTFNQFSVSRPETGTNGMTWIALGEYSTQPVPQPNSHMWHTSDGGQTWRNIKTSKNTDPTKNSHYHGCAHDPHNGMRLYSSQGDNGNNVFAYTDDPESVTPTWTVVATVPDLQPVTVGVFPDRVFLSPDDTINRAGMWVADPAALTAPVEVWQSPNAETATFTFGRSPYAQDTERAVVIIPDRFTGTNLAYFVGTGDSGKTWHLLYTMPLASAGSGSNSLVGPDGDGLIYYKSPAVNPAPALDNLMVAPMPTFRPIA